MANGPRITGTTGTELLGRSSTLTLTSLNAEEETSQTRTSRTARQQRLAVLRFWRVKPHWCGRAVRSYRHPVAGVEFKSPALRYQQYQHRQYVSMSLTCRDLILPTGIMRYLICPSPNRMWRTHMVSAITAFWAWRRFSAWSKTALQRPSMTSSATSMLRSAGSGCM